MSTEISSSFLPYAKHQIVEDDVAAVSHALRSGVLTRGPKVDEFEEAIASYCGASFAVAFNSGSTALRAACFAGGVTDGDRLITTPNTFAATSIAGMSLGASPVFLDIDPETGNMDPKELEKHLVEPRSRGRNIVLPVHYAGIPIDMRRFNALVPDPYALIIEDAAAALGSEYDRDHRVGSCAGSDMTIFSFHPAKLITTGEGGIVTTNDHKLARRLRAYRNNGIERDPSLLTEFPGPWYYEVLEMTGNYNFTDFQAALGLSQLGRIRTMMAKRRQLVGCYADNLADAPYIQLLPGLIQPGTCPHLAVVRIDFVACGIARAVVMGRLFDRGIGSQVHYIPVYRHPFFQKISGDLSDYFPNTELFYQQTLSLPLYQDLTEADVQRICRVLKEIVKKPSL